MARTLLDCAGTLAGPELVAACGLRELLLALLRSAGATAVVTVTRAIVAALKMVEVGRDHLGTGS